MSPDLVSKTCDSITGTTENDSSSNNNVGNNNLLGIGNGSSTNDCADKINSNSVCDISKNI